MYSIAQWIATSIKLDAKEIQNDPMRPMPPMRRIFQVFWGYIGFGEKQTEKLKSCTLHGIKLVFSAL